MSGASVVSRTREDVILFCCVSTLSLDDLATGRVLKRGVARAVVVQVPALADVNVPVNHEAQRLALLVRFDRDLNAALKRGRDGTPLVVGAEVEHETACRVNQDGLLGVRVRANAEQDVPHSM